jgi:hypothetical protein
MGWYLDSHFRIALRRTLFFGQSQDITTSGSSKISTLSKTISTTLFCIVIFSLTLLILPLQYLYLLIHTLLLNP